MNRRTVGITTTVPVEILFAAGCQPVDLNNLFVADSRARQQVEKAEQAGFPQSTCAWIKGLYSTIHDHGIDEVVGVVEGDCSDTCAMLEILESEGIKVIPFAYPHSHDSKDLEREMVRFAERFNTSLKEADTVKGELDAIRELAREVDTCAWQKGNITSDELFRHLLLLSDFGESPDRSRVSLSAFLEEAQQRPAAAPAIRLACVGVPTILTDLWAAFEQAGARFVDFEIPRQFARIDAIGQSTLQSYAEYTYPYSMRQRLFDIQQQVAERKVDGIVHYVQSFCHRQIQDRLLRENLKLPILTIEGDRPGRVDERTRTRIEAFCEQIAFG